MSQPVAFVFFIRRDSHFGVFTIEMQEDEQDIIRYFLDELTPAAQEALMNKLVQDPALMVHFKEYERIFDKASQYRHKADAQPAFENLTARIKNYPVKKTRSNYRMPVAVFAVFVFAIGVWIFIGQKNTPQKEHHTMVNTVCSSKGQKALIILTDGSKVTLNSGSKLYYPNRFNGSIRMIKLEGEAFFEVTKNPQKPFCVLSGSLLTRVLGTSFNIKNFGGSNTISITVASGHVAVDEFNGKNYKQISDLLPEQQLSFNKQNHSARIYSVSSSDATAWKENRLVFNNTPFSEIASSLQRLYGVQVVYPKKTLAKTAFSARFSSNTSLAEVMRTLAATGQISYTIKDSILHIKKR